MAIYQNGKEVTPKLNGKNLSRVMYNGKQIWPIGIKNIILINKADSVAGDICIADNNKNLLFCRFVDSGATHKLSDYTPIGLTAVPVSHGHYADGKCAITSLNHMNCDTPQIGGSSQYMFYGVYNKDISSLPNLNQVAYVGDKNEIGNNVIGQTESSHLPSDDISFTIPNQYDTKTKYCYFEVSNIKYSSSPYSNDGTFNSNYSLTTSPSSTANCLSDFDGYNNTKKIIEVREIKDYSSWKPTWSNEDDYPAASCCDMYSTYGTNQGEWYLPAAGELGYAVVRQQTINDTINKLISYNIENIDIFKKESYWSSSEDSSMTSRCLNFGEGSVFLNDKNHGFYVRAFRLV